MLKSTRLATDTYRRGPKPTGVAVVGVDHPGRRVLRVLRENFQAEVLWLCDPDQERLENLERRCPGARVATGIDGVVDDPAVEAVFVGGPAEAKCGLITQVLEAGKHVFIHTPQAWASEPPDEIADTASAHGRILEVRNPAPAQPTCPRDQAGRVLGGDGGASTSSPPAGWGPMSRPRARRHRRPRPPGTVRRALLAGRTPGHRARGQPRRGPARRCRHRLHHVDLRVRAPGEPGAQQGGPPGPLTHGARRPVPHGHL